MRLIQRFLSALLITNILLFQGLLVQIPLAYATNPADTISFASQINSANQNSVSITGTSGVNNATVNYTISDTDAGNTTPDITGTVTTDAANGAISISGKNLSSLLDGTVTVSVTLDLNDGSGASSAIQNTTIKDTVAPAQPVITSVAGNSIIDTSEKSAIHIIGTADANSLVSVTLTDHNANVKSGNQQLAGGATDYDITIDGTTGTALADGTINVSVTAADAAGNVSPAQTSSPTQDTVAPTAAITYSATGPYKSGTVVTITATFTESINGTPKIALSAPANLAATAMSSSAPNVFTYLYTIGAGNGDATVSLSVGTDAAGNAIDPTPSSGGTLTLDNTAPTLDSFSSSTASGTYGPGATVNVTATYNETLKAGSTVSVVLNNTQAVTLSSVSGSTLSGTYTVGATGSGQDNSALDVTSISSQSALDVAGNTLTTTLMPGTNISSARTIVIDTTKPSQPTISSVAANDVINNSEKAAITVVGTAEANSTVSITLTRGANSVTTAGSANGAGGYSINVNGTAATPAPLVDGTVNVSVTAADASGNVSIAQTTTATQDTALPTFSSVTPSNNAYINNVSSASLIAYSLSESVTSGTVTITRTGGTADGSSPHSCSLVGTALSSGAHTLNLSDTSNGCSVAQTLVDDAVYTLDFDATDSAGNNAVTVSRTAVTYDISVPASPSVTITNPVNNSNKAAVTISGTGEAGATINYSITDGTHTVSNSAVVSGGGAYSITNVNLTTIDDGSRTVYVTATDAASNTSPSANAVFDKDVAAPTLSAVSIASNNANTALAKTGNIITVSFTSNENIQSPTVTIAGHAASVSGSNSSWSATYTMTGSDTEGVVAFNIAFTDTVGNAGVAITATTNSSSVTFDRTAPSAPVVSSVSVDNKINNSEKAAITVTGTAEPNATVTITLTNGANSVTTTAAVNGAGGYSTNLDGTAATPAALDDGTITASVTATDASGNTSSAGNRTAAQDTVAPTTPTASLLNPVNSGNKTAVTLSGAGETGTTVNYTIADSGSAHTVSGSTTVAGGTYSFSGINLTSLNDGTVTATVTLTDSAGNVSANGTDTATKDTAAPILSTVTIASDNANTALAKTANTLTLNFTSSENIQTPVVTIAGHSVTPTGSNSSWSAAYPLVGTDTEGTVAFSITATDIVGNAATAITATTDASSITFDRTAPTLNSFSSTTSSGTYGPSSAINVTATYNESLGSGSTVAITLNNGAALTLSTVSGSTLTGTYTVGATGVSQDISALQVATITSQNAADLAGTARTTTTLPGTNISPSRTIAVDTTAPVFSSVLPANSTVINNVTTSSALHYTLSESLVGGVGTVVFTQTGGAADSNHTCTLVGTALSAGAHILNLSDTTNGCTSGITLVDGAIYTLTFDGRDSINNNAATVTRTGINYVTAQVDSGQTLLQPDTTVSNSNPQVVVGNVPTDAVITVPSSVTNPSLDVSSLVVTSGSEKTATLNGNIQINSTTSSGSFSVQLPAGLTVTGPASSWTGTINAPQVQSASSVTLPSIAGVDIHANAIIEVGFGDVPLTFNKAVRLVIEGQAGKTPAYSRSGTLTQITASCASDNQAAMDAGLPAGGECAINVGSDLVIWTKHFTKFIAYTQNSLSSSGGTSGDGSPASAPQCTNSAPGGAPSFTKAVAGTNSVTLFWNEAPDPVTYYLVTYGASTGAQTYGNPNVGGKGTTSYTINGLSGGTTYYFRVRAGNGCMPGSYSGEISATPGGGFVSGPAAGFAAGVLGASVKASANGTLTNEQSDQNVQATGEVKGASTNTGSEIAAALPSPSSSSTTGLFQAVGGFFGAIFGFIGKLFGR